MYCDFYSIEAKGMMGRFLEALEKEIEGMGEKGQGTVYDTVFFGGGTPSLMTAAELGRILTALHRNFTIAEGAEITVEANPGTVTAGSLAAYRSLGVNRLSIGVQSFDESELKFLGRIHDREQAVRCVEAAREAGFEKFSIDMMYALPGQTAEQWGRNLEQALELDPPHMSAYGLIVEDGTPLARMVAARQVSPSPAEQEAELYLQTMEFLEARGYEHYEVSNYARPGSRSIHNWNYWKGGRYLGFGPSAHSFWSGEGGRGEARRWWNVRDLGAYLRRLENGETAVLSGEVLGRQEQFTERVFLGLRSDGLDLRSLEDEFGADVLNIDRATVDAVVAEGLATFESDVLRLTRRGYLLCDEIAVKILDTKQ